MAALLDGASDRESYIGSLELIRDLGFDLVVPSVTSAGQPYYAFTDTADTQRRVDAIIERLRRGGVRP